MYQCFVYRALSRFCTECKILHKKYQQFLTELLVGFDSFRVELFHKFKLVLNTHDPTFYKSKIISELIIQKQASSEDLFKYYNNLSN
jgi:hypothetical protein